MSNYLLIHGAWGGAWEFDETIKGLEAHGHRAAAIDLPGHGKSKEPISEVTMKAYIARVLDALNPIDGPVVLVGHSLAGAIVSQVAELAPDKIERLIFVAAMLPKTGDTPLGLMQSDSAGELLPVLKFSDDESYVTVGRSEVESLLLNDVNEPERMELFAPHFDMKQATEPFMYPAELSDQAFGSVPKTYVRAALDKVLSPALQDEMISNWKVDQVFTLESGHFPLMSMPERLNEVLLEAASVSAPRA